MEQNETGCQASQAPILCANNCGFFGTAATMNMCSKCYKDVVLKQDQVKFVASSIQNIVNGTSSTSETKLDAATTTSATKNLIIHTVVASSPQAAAAVPLQEDKEKEVKEGPKRCGSCEKRVGLTGFKCRCGGVFCSIHRYSDKHECPFDYRSAGQEVIAKANPVIKADKLDKI